MGIRSVLAVLSIFFMAIFLSGNAIASNISGEVTIPPGEHWSHRMELNQTYHWLTGDLAEIGYHFEVLSGPNVDILLFTEENYSRYLLGLSAAHIPVFSDLNVDKTGGSPYLGPGTYYYVIDNSDYGEASPENESATVEYTISYPDGGGSGNFLTLAWIFLIGLLAIMLVAVILIVALIRKEMLGARQQPLDGEK